MLFVKACLIGDGSLTPITREGRNTVMLSFTHCLNQKPWLQVKAQRLNEMFGRSCKVGEGEVFDKRTNRTYYNCQYSLTSKDFLPVLEAVYPNGQKTFKTGWLNGLTVEHLAVAWADDGNLEPKDRIGRLNVYMPEDECQTVASWIESICGAVGRYEDYEEAGVGRLRFPASEMVKIAVAIKPFLHPTMAYKIDMQYKRNTKNRLTLTASSPNDSLPRIEDIPEAKEIKTAEWRALAKSVGVSSYSNLTNQQMRDEIIRIIKIVNGR